MKKILDRLPRFSLSTIIVAATLYFTLFPKPLGAEHVPLFAGADKVAHAVMFFGVAYCLLLDFRRGRKEKRAVEPVAVLLFSVLLGGLIELAQWQLATGRSGDWLDFAADAVGALSGVGACVLWLKNKKTDGRRSITRIGKR